MTKENNQGMRNEWKERLDLAFAYSSDDASSKALVEWFQSEISLLKKGIEDSFDKYSTEHYHSTAQGDLFINLSRAKDIVRKAGE